MAIILHLNPRRSLDGVQDHWSRLIAAAGHESAVFAQRFHLAIFGQDDFGIASVALLFATEPLEEPFVETVGRTGRPR